MKLQQIAAKNLKGRTFNHSLQDLTVIAGPNDTGKTAIADAIHLVLTGNAPGQKATNAGIFALSSGSTLHVQGTFEDGNTVARTWKKSGAKVSLTEEGVEGLPATPTVLLDAGEFFGASDAQRVKMAFGLMDLSASGITTGGIVKELAALEGTAGLKWLPDDAPLQEWLDLAIDAAAKELTALNGEVRTYTNGAQAIAGLGAQEIPLDPAVIAQKIQGLRAKLTETEKEKAKADHVLAEATKNAEGIRARHRQATELRAKVGDHQVIAGPAEDLEQALEEARAAFNEATQAALAYSQALESANIAKEALGTLEEELKALEASVARIPALEERIQTIENERKETVELAGYQAAQDAAAIRHAELGVNVKAHTDQIAALADKVDQVTRRPCCPECGTEGEEMKEAAKAYYGAQITEAKTALDHLCGLYQVAKDELEKAQGALNDAQARKAAQDKLDQEHRDAIRDLAELVKAKPLLETRAAQKAKLEKAAKAPKAPTGDTPERIQTRVTTLTTQLERKRAADTLAIVSKDLPEVPNLEALENGAYQLECELTEIRDQVTAAEAEEKAAAAQLGDRKRLQQAQDERLAAEAKVEAVKAIKEKLTATREDLVHKAMDPLLATANRFTAGILKSPLEIRDGEIGRQDGASWIPVRAFGGTYTAVTYAAIQTALGTKAPCRVVIVDELGRMDKTNKLKFLANVREALAAGDLEQFVGIDPDPESFAKAPKKLGLHIIETAA